MRYWVWLQKNRGEQVVFEDGYLPGWIPERILDMMVDRFVDDKLGLCDGCEMAYKSHIIEEGSGRKFCPVLFHDALRPSWKIEQLV